MKILATICAVLLLPFAAQAMDVKAKTAIIIDAATGKVLWAREADKSMFPASTTKIMTAMLLIENCLPSDIITAPEDIETVKEASMHLKPGEQVSAKNMLYAMLLRSANDSCYATALHIAGSVDKFADMMNARARQIGCTNTNFHNPNGLNDTLHTTSAHDLALMAREAMKYEAFRQVVKTRSYIIERSINQKDRHMISHDKFLAKDPSAEGIKTGYTVPAGHCFVGGATRNDFRVITVVMKSENWVSDTQQMMDWAFKNYEKTARYHLGEVVERTTIEGKEIPLVAAGDTFFLGRKGDKITRRIEVVAKAPIERGAPVGFLVLQDSEGFEQKVPVNAGEAVEVPSIAAVGRVSTSPWGIALGSLLFAGLFFVKGRARRFGYGSTTSS